MASSATATSSRPLNPAQRQNPVQRQNTGFSRPTQQSPDLRDKGSPGGGGYTSSEDARKPYANLLLSLDKIPRAHHILASVFVWVLLAGFVVIPGSFTSAKRKQDGDTVQVPVGGAGGSKLALTPANTAAMVVGLLCIVAGTFGSAWLALRWRRNYIWLLNKLYAPLILNALAGLLATVSSVYTQQAGEWSTQAIITAIIEASVLVVSAILFFVYNLWLMKKVRGGPEDMAMDREEKKEKKEKKKKNKKDKKGKKDKKEKKEKKKGGLWARIKARFRRNRKKKSTTGENAV